jgi:hypothetical protein
MSWSGCAGSLRISSSNGGNMSERLKFVAGVAAVLLLVYLLTTWAYAMGRSELYGKVLEWRMQSDSATTLLQACAR